MKRDNNSVLEYIEYDIVGHCNLNCKGCSHFSNIQKEKQFVQLKDFEKDLTRLSNLFSEIKRIKILGGEPLLHPDFDKLITSARKILPNTRIDIVTNGLLVEKMSSEVWNVIRKNNAKLIVTIYNPTEKLKSKIINVIEKEKIWHEFYESKNEFRRQLTKEKRNRAYASHEKCSIKNCTGIVDGKLGKCPMSIHINRYNQKFSTDFPENEYISIHDNNITAKDILKFIKEPIKLCKYCSTKHEFFEWGQASYDNAKEEDWICKYNEGNEKEYVKIKINSVFKNIESKLKKGYSKIKKMIKKIIKKIMRK